MTLHIVEKYRAPVPRYTSYPTAPHFSPRIGELQYVSWLAGLASGARLSLYLHIPFCHSLCWHCGCNTKATQRYEPVSQYLRHLNSEITNVSALIPDGHVVTHMHWGGGSPNILSAHDLTALAHAIRSSFNIRDNAEFAVEIDPRHLDAAQADSLLGAGVNRVSIGVQDFEPTVQAAIGRQQSFKITKTAVDCFRARGIGSINIDLIYGLPHQTRKSIDRTIEQVLELEPDRIATFGYAHLPERLKHQRLIPQEALPSSIERYAQSSRIARRLRARGYVRIGLDHFAKPSDALAREPLSRNFQGYTTDQADALIGLGASAISRLPEGYAQNAAALGDYMRRMTHCGLATVRGVGLTQEDRVRACVIERLMCDLAFSGTELRRRFGGAAEPIISEARALLEADEDGLLRETADGFSVTEHGRTFVRSICACFDSYLDTDGARYSVGV